MNRLEFAGLVSLVLTVVGGVALVIGLALVEAHALQSRATNQTIPE